jgi:acyl-CoA synthetase (AMP-forming)/AMP-acid ligase II
MPGNVSVTLDVAAQQAGDRVAVVMPDGEQRTYAELRDEAAAVAAGLAHDGIEPGMRVLLMAPPSPALFAATFALFRLGAVPIFIDPGMGALSLSRCVERAAPEAMIGVPRAHVARLLLGWRRGAWRRLYTMKKLAGVAARGAGKATAPATGSTAAILFTSGSTGEPKGVVYEHRHFLAQIALLRQTYGIEPGEVDVGTFPLFALFAPALGMTAVVPAMDFTRPGHVDPRRIFDAVDRHGATTMFGSPALLRRLALSDEARRRKLPSLRRVISAGAPVSPEILAAFTRLLAPGVPIHTPYGATEALPVATVDSREILADAEPLTRRGRGILVGRPVAGTTVRIMRVLDDAVPVWSDALAAAPGEVGEIVVEGEQVTAAYDGLPGATALAKLCNPATGRLMHRMGDLGYWDEAGRLWFCGRKAHRVSTPAGALDSVPCEGIFDGHPHVARSALVGRGEVGRMEPVLCVETVRPLTRAARKQLEGELLAMAASHAMTRTVRELRFFPELPVDTRHNAKILREKLKRRLDRHPSA